MRAPATFAVSAGAPSRRSGRHSGLGSDGATRERSSSTAGRSTVSFEPPHQSTSRRGQPPRAPGRVPLAGALPFVGSLAIAVACAGRFLPKRVLARPPATQAATFGRRLYLRVGTSLLPLQRFIHGTQFQGRSAARADGGRRHEPLRQDGGDDARKRVTDGAGCPQPVGDGPRG